MSFAGAMEPAAASDRAEVLNAVMRTRVLWVWDGLETTGQWPMAEREALLALLRFSGGNDA